MYAWCGTVAEWAAYGYVALTPLSPTQLSAPAIALPGANARL
jgi:hypothetical protein